MTCAADLREFSDVAVVMLTAKATEADILAGFEAGADDYLTKPFSAKELIARVQAVLRRTQRPGEAVTSSLICGELEINFARAAVTVRGQPVALTRTEYELLQQLARNANRVISHVELLTNVWGPSTAMISNTSAPTFAICARSLRSILQTPTTFSPPPASATCSSAPRNFVLFHTFFISCPSVSMRFSRLP